MPTRRAGSVRSDVQPRGSGLAGNGHRLLLFQQQLQVHAGDILAVDAAAQGVPAACCGFPGPTTPPAAICGRSRGNGRQRGRLVFAPFFSNLRRSPRAAYSRGSVPRHVALQRAHHAGDALCTGVPVITTRGPTFAGRVAASVLHAAGYPSSSTGSLEAYEARALELARNPSELADLKERLKRGRRSQPLFDTARFTRHLESAYITMWERYQSGEPPAHFAVPRVEG